VISGEEAVGAEAVGTEAVGTVGGTGVGLVGVGGTGVGLVGVGGTGVGGTGQLSQDTGQTLILLPNVPKGSIVLIVLKSVLQSLKSLTFPQVIKIPDIPRGWSDNNGGRGVLGVLGVLGPTSAEINNTGIHYRTQLCRTSSLLFSHRRDHLY